MSFIAQTAETAPVLFAYGPMGVILGWFMLRGEKLIVETRSLSHRIDGLTRALLADMIERETCSDTAKRYAQEAITKIDERSKPKSEI